MPSTTRSTFFTYPTKFGPVTIAADGTAVTAVSFGEQNLPGDRQPTALTTEAANQIMAYLAGQRSAFTVPMRPEGSAFQQEVWKAAANIPYGHTTTARALAETLGRPGSFRSVGAALRAGRPGEAGGGARPRHREPHSAKGRFHRAGGAAP